MRTDDDFAESKLIAEGKAQMMLMDGVLPNAKLALEVLRSQFPAEWTERRNVQVIGSVAHGLLPPAAISQLGEFRGQQDAIDVDELKEVGG